MDLIQKIILFKKWVEKVRQDNIASKQCFQDMTDDEKEFRKNRFVSKYSASIIDHYEENAENFSVLFLGNNVSIKSPGFLICYVEATIICFRKLNRRVIYV